MSSDSPATDPTVSISELRCQVPPGVLAIGDEVSRLTWRVEPPLPDRHQLAYQIVAADDAEFAVVVADSGRVPGAEQVAVQAPGPALTSRQVRYYRVRIETEAGWADWSPALRVEAGLLDPGDWTATAITLPDETSAREVRDHMLGSGVIARPIGEHSIAYCPPLVVTDQELAQILESTSDALRAAR